MSGQAREHWAGLRLAFMALTVMTLVGVLPPRAAAQITSPGSPAPETAFYLPLDLTRAAQEQYGRSATAVATGDHLYSWMAKVRTELKPLDLSRAVTSQYGVSYTLVAVGVGLWDWRAVNLSSLPRTVLPVMAVASDRFFNVRGVRSGLSRYVSVLSTMRNWYKARDGKTFRLLQPLVVPTNRTSDEWNRLSASTADPAHRFDLLFEAIAAYRAHLPARTENLRVTIAPFSGSNPEAWLGAASIDGFAVAPPRATSVSCPLGPPLDEGCSDATYALGHELGHTFGLPHSCDAYPTDPNCGRSIMQTGKPWEAILLPGEVSQLDRSGFFFGRVFGS